MTDWNSFEDRSISLIIQATDNEHGLFGSLPPTANETIYEETAEHPMRVKARARARKYLDTDDRLDEITLEKANRDSQARQERKLSDVYEAFDNGTDLLTFKAQPDCVEFKFKVLEMGDDQDESGHMSMMKSQSTIQMFFGKKKKEIQWREVFSFSFLVNKVPEERPYLYLNRGLDRLICQR